MVKTFMQQAQDGVSKEDLEKHIKSALAEKKQRIKELRDSALKAARKVYAAGKQMEQTEAQNKGWPRTKEQLEKTTGQAQLTATELYNKVEFENTKANLALEGIY